MNSFAWFTIIYAKKSLGIPLADMGVKFSSSVFITRQLALKIAAN